jgi:hypothetical protein
VKHMVATAAVTLTAALVGAAPAMAEDTDASEFTGETATAQFTPQTVETCTDPSVAPLLSTQKDDDLYFVAPGGDFEQGADGWTLEGGAQITFGSSAFAPLGSGQRSLQLPAGATATSPAFCVDERYPHFRIAGGNLGVNKAKIRVSVVYPGLTKNVRHAEDLDVDHKDDWKLSKKIKVQPNYGRKVGGWRLVALRFEVEDAKDGVDARVDDILVDPKMRY